MNIKVESGVLRSALRVANLCTDNKGGISSNLLFRRRGETTEVLSKSTRVFSLSPLTCETESDGDSSFTVEAWRLTQWVNNIGDNSTITLSYKDGYLTAKSGRSSVKFRSLDPEGFRTWDSLFESSLECCEVDPSVISSAISAGKVFVSQEDNIKPENCQLVAWDTFLASTDRKGVCNVTTPYKGLGFRIPSKDIPVVLKFLDDRDTVNRELIVRSSNRTKDEGGAEFDFFVRPDGSYLGVSRLALVPRMVMAPDKNHETHAVITVRGEEFQKALSFLQSSAPVGHPSIKFTTLSGDVSLSMPSAAGGEDHHPLVSTNSTGSDLSFFLEHHYITSLFGLFGVKQIELGVFKSGDKGYVTFHHADPLSDKNSYSVALLCHF